MRVGGRFYLVYGRLGRVTMLGGSYTDCVQVVLAIWTLLGCPIGSTYFTRVVLDRGLFATVQQSYRPSD